MLYADLYQRQQLHMWCLWLPLHTGRSIWVVFSTTDSSRMQMANGWWLRLYFEIFCQAALINPLIMSKYYVAVVFGVSHEEGRDVWFLLHCWQSCAEALKCNQNEINITVENIKCIFLPRWTHRKHRYIKVGFLLAGAGGCSNLLFILITGFRNITHHHHVCAHHSAPAGWSYLTQGGLLLMQYVLANAVALLLSRGLHNAVGIVPTKCRYLPETSQRKPFREWVGTQDVTMWSL